MPQRRRCVLRTLRPRRKVAAHTHPKEKNLRRLVVGAKEFIQNRGSRFLPLRGKFQAVLAQRLSLAGTFVYQDGVAAIEPRLAEHAVELLQNRIEASNDDEQRL